METLVFDCDGVLVDSEIVAETALAEQLQIWLPDLETHSLVRDTLGMTTQDILRHFETLSHHALPDNALYRIDKAIDERLKRELRAIDGVADVLSRLTLPLAIASNSSRRRVLDSLATTGLDTWLSSVPIFTAQQVAHPKPDPGVYRLAACAMSCWPEDCLVVEDSVPGVSAAHAAGMTVIGFTGASHVQENQAEKLRQAGAWRILGGMEGLESLIESWRELRCGQARGVQSDV